MPNGLLAINNIQIVGIHKAIDASGNCLRSNRSMKRTNIVQRSSASGGGMIYYRLTVDGLMRKEQEKTVHGYRLSVKIIKFHET